MAAQQSDRLTSGGFAIAGSQSLAVQHALEEQFPRVPRSALAAVRVPEPDATRAQLRAARERVAEAVAGRDEVRMGVRARRAQLRRDGPTVLPLRLDVVTDGDPVDLTRDLRRELSPGETRDGVRTYLVGYGSLWSGLSEQSKEDLAVAELVSFPIVAAILLAVFGSLAAAVPPLALGFVTVTLTGAAVYLLSHQIEMSVVAATGYRRRLEPLLGHLGVLDADGNPHESPSAPGLHFIGFTDVLTGNLREMRLQALALARAA